MPTPALSELTTMRVGGVPDRLIEPKTTDDLVEVSRAIWASGENWLLLGGGSNMVASDDGFDGTVIRIATRGIERAAASTADRVRLRVQAGEPWDDVVAYAVRNGWSGIETLSGIPGFAGAAPVQNIGAYGQELASTLLAIDFLDYETGEVSRIEASELGLGYRTSSLKRGRLGIVLAIELGLVEDADLGAALSAPVAYAQLAERLGVSLGARVPLAEVRRAVLELRATKGMLLDDTDPDSVSSGSFFTNPIVTESFARSLPADAPRWPMQSEDDAPQVIPLETLGPLPVIDALTAPIVQPAQAAVKLSAAWLIENTGIRRGFSLPGSRAAISTKHTLAIVNTGGVSAEQVAELARYMRSRVQAEFGIILQPEPTLVDLQL